MSVLDAYGHGVGYNAERKNLLISMSLAKASMNDGAALDTHKADDIADQAGPARRNTTWNSSRMSVLRSSKKEIPVKTEQPGLARLSSFKASSFKAGILMQAGNKRAEKIKEIQRKEREKKRERAEAGKNEEQDPSRFGVFSSSRLNSALGTSRPLQDTCAHHTKKSCLFLLFFVCSGFMLSVKKATRSERSQNFIIRGIGGVAAEWAHRERSAEIPLNISNHALGGLTKNVGVQATAGIKMTSLESSS